MRTRYHSPSPLSPALTRIKRIGAALALSLPMLAAAAGEGAETSAWGLGIGVISAQKAYAGADRENRVLPVILYENSWVRVLGPVAEVKLPRLGISDREHIDFRLVARYDGSGYEADDAPILGGMAKRKSGVWVGGKATWHNEFANLGAEWTADVTGHSKGQRFSLSLEKNWRLGQQVMLAPRLGATWYDKKYVDYYYGVRAGEATPGRAAYSGKAGVNIELSLRGTYLFDPRNSVFVDVGVTRLATEIKASPLAGRSTENRVFAGYLYRF